MITDSNVCMVSGFIATWGIILLTGMLMLWAIFGVYRTVVQARAPKQYTDLV